MIPLPQTSVNAIFWKCPWHPSHIAVNHQLCAGIRWAVLVVRSGYNISFRMLQIAKWRWGWVWNKTSYSCAQNCTTAYVQLGRIQGGHGGPMPPPSGLSPRETRRFATRLAHVASLTQYTFCILYTIENWTIARTGNKVMYNPLLL